MNKTKQLWISLRWSFWFRPLLIVVFSVVLAAILIEIDSRGTNQWLTRWPRLFGAEAEGARAMMSTIAGSIMTVVGVTFSMVLMVLALASSQYTSRILRNFMRSRVTQDVLGIFAGIFTYNLIVLRTIRGGDEGAFVPSLAVFFGFVLALGGIGALVFFIHHIASSIQASSIIAAVAEETIVAIDRLFPDKIDQGAEEEVGSQTLHSLAEKTWHAVPSKESGYIQSVNSVAILRLARDGKTIVRMEHDIGDFIIQNTTLVSLALKDPPDRETIAALQATFSISRHRTVEQDAAFGIRQIVDVALKALSPGVNDTTTAVTCVDYLTVILVRLAPRQLSSSYHYEGEELRMISKGPSFADLLAESFSQIRSNAKNNVAIILRLLDAIRTLSDVTPSPHRRRALREQLQWILELAERTVEAVHDHARIAKRLACVRDALEAGFLLCAEEENA